MCKFCNMELGDCKLVKSKKVKIKVGNKVRSEESLTVYLNSSENGSYTLDADYWMYDDGCPTITASTPIKYCPFCGRKLHND